MKNIVSFLIIWLICCHNIQAIDEAEDQSYNHLKFETEESAKIKKCWSNLINALNSDKTHVYELKYKLIADNFVANNPEITRKKIGRDRYDLTDFINRAASPLSSKAKIELNVSKNTLIVIGNGHDLCVADTIFERFAYVSLRGID